MVQLGRRFGAGPVSLAEVAEAEALPRAYLEQLVIGLREAGLVVSTRGAHGGYQLSRPPTEMGMGEVLRALEGPIAPMICATEGPAVIGEPICERGAGCTVSMLWVRVRDAIVDTLDSTTLDELLRPHALPLIQLAARESNPATIASSRSLNQ
jgi:Rrf2 family transcriptional regulator, cysteine metabolism repressor